MGRVISAGDDACCGDKPDSAKRATQSTNQSINQSINHWFIKQLLTNSSYSIPYAI